MPRPLILGATYKPIARSLIACTVAYSAAFHNGAAHSQMWNRHQIGVCSHEFEAHPAIDKLFEKAVKPEEQSKECEITGYDMFNEVRGL